MDSMDYSRSDRLSDHIRTEVSLILKSEVKDPRLNGLTVTRVEVSKNLKKAYIYYSSSNSFNATDSIDTNKGLQKATGFIRKLLGQRIKIKRIPEICFEVDRSEDLL